MRTCKLFNRLAMPRLYRTLRVKTTYGSALGLGYHDCIHRPGMKYVKEVYLSPTPQWYDDSNLWASLEQFFLDTLSEAQLEKLM